MKDHTLHDHPDDLVVNQQELKRNQTLYLPNDTFSGLYLVQRGALKVCQIDEQGHELIRGFYFRGEALGYEAIYKGYYTSYAIALCQTIVCEIPYENFLKLMQKKPDLQRYILFLISQQMNTNSFISSMSAEQRVASCLLEFSDRLQFLKNDSKFYLPMSRQDLGNYLGLAGETVSRILSHFNKQKIIEIKNKEIHILQPEKLRSF